MAYGVVCARASAGAMRVGVIVIGFSVDYTVHLGHMYKEGIGSREEKVSARTRPDANPSHLSSHTL
eukprot:1884813-Rhodomonas_salina.2